MKTHLIKKWTIEQYASLHAGSKSSLTLWLAIVKRCDWNSPQDILGTFASADLLGNGCDRVIFDIGGNKYRMICHYVFGENEVHLFAEYTKLCKSNKQYTVSDY
jgi:mRNA interferase HigB